MAQNPQASRRNFGAKARVLSIAASSDSVEIAEKRHGDDCRKTGCSGHYEEQIRGNEEHILECRRCRHTLTPNDDQSGDSSNVAADGGQAVYPDYGTDTDARAKSAERTEDTVFPDVLVDQCDLIGEPTGIATVSRYQAVDSTGEIADTQDDVGVLLPSGEETIIESGAIRKIGDREADYYDDPSITVALPPTTIIRTTNGDVTWSKTAEEYREIRVEGNRPRRGDVIVVGENGEEDLYPDATIASVGKTTQSGMEDE